MAIIMDIATSTADAVMYSNGENAVLGDRCLLSNY